MIWTRQAIEDLDGEDPLDELADRKALLSTIQGARIPLDKGAPNAKT